VDIGDSRTMRKRRRRRERMMGLEPTQLDGQQELGRVASGDDGWAAFLREHPELTDRRDRDPLSRCTRPSRLPASSSAVETLPHKILSFFFRFFAR
jgi:hypothetical protein